MVVVSCSSAISPQETHLQTENYRGLGHAVDLFADGIRSRFGSNPYSIATIALSAGLGVIVQKFRA